MSNIYLKGTTKKNWRSQNFDFVSLRNSSPGQFWGAPTQADIIVFSIFLLQIQNQMSGSKNVCGFSIISIPKEI